MDLGTSTYPKIVLPFPRTTGGGGRQLLAISAGAGRYPGTPTLKTQIYHSPIYWAGWQEVTSKRCAPTSTPVLQYKYTQVRLVSVCPVCCLSPSPPLYTHTRFHFFLNLH